MQGLAFYVYIYIYLRLNIRSGDLGCILLLEEGGYDRICIVLFVVAQIIAGICCLVQYSIYSSRYALFRDLPVAHNFLSLV